MVIKKNFIENTTVEEKIDSLNEEKKAFPVKEIIKAKKQKQIIIQVWLEHKVHERS